LLAAGGEGTVVIGEGARLQTRTVIVPELDPVGLAGGGKDEGFGAVMMLPVARESGVATSVDRMMAALRNFIGALRT
jgi:hypothetical protein